MKLARSRLTHAQTGHLLEHFVAGTPARAVAELAGVNRNTARLFYHRLRELIARRLGYGAAALPAGEARAPVFGLIAADGAVRAQLRPAPGERFDALVVLRAAHEGRVLRAADLCYERAPHGAARADEFWALAQRLLASYNGMPRAHFHLFLAECEWRLQCGAPRRCLHVLRYWLSRA